MKAISVLLLIGLAVPAAAVAQGRGGRGAGPAGPAPTAKAIAPEDVVGTYVSVVTEHWHLRMLVPPKGDVSMIPVNPEARRLVGMWDPAKEPAGDEQCKAYGAAAIMRVPGRIDIRWADDNTLKMDIDSGTQTRMFHFNAPAPAGAAPSWQGYSEATWPAAGRGRGGDSSVGHLKVTTTNMKAGYLRKNGIPYSDKAVLDEYYDHFTEPDGTTWLVVTTMLTDPTYLTGQYVTTNQFKKIPDRQGWDPTPCRADQVR